jgi:competence protein ComEC
MAIIVLLAKATGRTYDMGRALLLAGTAMVLHDPGILLFDPSFQLSFLASLGLVLVSPVLERRMRLFRNSPVVREVLVSTLATQILVLPILLYQTGMLSVIALPMNLIVLPLIPISMLLGFFAAVFAMIVPWLAFLFGLPVYLPLHFIMEAARYASLVPYAALSVGNVPVYVVLLMYLFIALALHLERKNASLRSFASVRRAPLSN